MNLSISDTARAYLNGKVGYFFWKRCFDIIGAIILSILFSLVMLLIAILIPLDSKGSVIYCQERLGKDGVPFIMYKFRSMYPDAEKNGPQLAESNDSRCTRLGSLLRKSHMDELPQLWNVLKGDMSLVGPRPEREYFYKQYEQTVPGFSDRLVIKPGLTGVAQIHGPYDLPTDQKLIQDMKYIRNLSLWVDFRCLLCTAFMLIGEVIVRWFR